MADNRILQIIAQMRANGATEEQIQQWAAANNINLNVPATIPNPTGITGMFSNLLGRAKSGQPLLGGQLPDFSKLGSTIRGTKLIEGGPTVGGLARAGMGIYQGANALKGVNENINTDKELRSLKEDILANIETNPMYDMYLDPSDERLIRQLKNGTLQDNWGGVTSGIMEGIPKAALTALIGGVTGGAGGAAIGGLGSLANSAISGYGDDARGNISKLQGLYNKLSQANEEYRSMKRPRGLSRAGLSTQYYNQLY